MRKSELLREPVRDLTLNSLFACGESARKLLEIYSNMGGFSARFLSKALELLTTILLAEDCFTIISFTANLVATGLRGLIADLLGERYVDAAITSGGTFDHDIAKALGKYYKGEFELNDVELERQGLHRLGNVLVPLEAYGPSIESFTHKMLEELRKIKEQWAPSELAWEVGKRITDDRSILKNAAERKIRVFTPSLVDSAFGTAIVTFNETLRGRGLRGIFLDFEQDVRTFVDLARESGKVGLLVLGGGTSRYHALWPLQLRGTIDYAVVITTSFEEALQVVRAAREGVTVLSDVTIALPLLMAALEGT